MRFTQQHVSTKIADAVDRARRDELSKFVPMLERLNESWQREIRWQGRWGVLCGIFCGFWLGLYFGTIILPQLWPLLLEWLRQT